MKKSWGIKNRVLFLSLFPTVAISLFLTVYFTNSKVKDLRQSLINRGIAISLQIAPLASYGIYSNNLVELHNMSKREVTTGTISNNEEINSITFYNERGKKIADPEDDVTQLDISSFKNNPKIKKYYIENKQELVNFIVPLFFKKIIIKYPLEDKKNPNIIKVEKSIIGWLKLELNKQSTEELEFKTLLISTLILMLSLCLSGFVALHMTGNFVNPILALVNFVNNVKKGQLGIHCEAKAKWELAILKSGINNMVRELEKYQVGLKNSIKQATRDLQSSLDSIEAQNIELRVAREDADKANNLKSEFLAKMSHEIRTPLNGLVGFTNLLNKTHLTERQKDFVEIIEKSARNLLSIINEILDFSKIEAGKLELVYTPIDIRDCIEDVLALLTPLAQDKDLELILYVYPDVPNCISSDPLHLKQVIINLVGNAIKFTEQGNIVIRVMLDKELDNNQKIILKIAVQDTGVGLSAKEQDNLFGSFQQVHRNRKSGGTGLGLVISRNIIENMAGEVGIDSVLGEGATFWFTFETRYLNMVINEKLQELFLLNKKIILYEENDISRLSLQNTLNNWGAEINCASDLIEVYSLIKTAIYEKKPFHLLLISINNAEAYESLVGDLLSIYNLYNCQVGILTNNTIYNLNALQADKGIQISLVKPISRLKLYETLEKKLFPKPISAVPSIVKEKQDNKSFSKVLAIDDNANNLKLLVTLLEEDNIAITTGSDGFQAIEAMKSQNFDVILMDIQMPGMNGIEATKMIRLLGYETPIVAITAYATKSEKELLFNEGANDYLTKPIDEHELKTIIYKWIKPNISDEKGKKNKSANMINNYYSQSPIDWQLCLKVTGGREKVAKEILNEFIENLPSDKNELQAAFASKDIILLKDTVHKVHGSCCYVGVPFLKSSIKDFEIKLNNVTDINMLLKDFNKLIEKIDSVLEVSIKDVI